MVTDEAENEKDIATEKEQIAPVAIAENGSESPAAELEAAASKLIENGINAVTNAIDETTTTLLNDSKLSEAAVAIGEEAVIAVEENANATGEEDSNKKQKKEKKKRWSFRSFSFSKKDKQKPSKKDDSATAATNGECEKVLEEVSRRARCRMRAHSYYVDFYFSAQYFLMFFFGRFLYVVACGILCKMQIANIQTQRGVQYYISSIKPRTERIKIESVFVETIRMPTFCGSYAVCSLYSFCMFLFKVVRYVHTARVCCISQFARQLH